MEGIEIISDELLLHPDSEITYIPDVQDDMKPKIEQRFDSLDAVYKFYNDYARKAGFSVRKSKGKPDKKSDRVIWKRYVCFKEGETDQTHRNNNEVEERGRKDTRTGCEAKLTVSYDGSHFVVKTFIEEHNHPPTTPSRIHILPSHRNVSVSKKNLIQEFKKVDLPLYQQFAIFETQSGGHMNVGCMEQDLRNAFRDERERVKGHDVDIVYEHFKAEQEKDPGFFYEFHTDEEQRLLRCFWVDSNARKAYSNFGDVVVFDTTYNTNRYKMIFAPFVGVNHHGQTIIFGCAFLSDETFDSFVWLLNTWLAAMPRAAPNVIITDQDQAMSKAIAHVLPNTCHRYCIWHILKKLPEKTSAAFMKNNYHAFKACIWDSECPDEFEKRRFEELKNSGQADNDWLGKMFDLREKWIPAYVNKYFSAGMSSSQRVESEHAFFKRYCSKENNLMDFITRFNRAIAHQRHKELVEDHKDLNETPVLKLGMPMEVQMARLYTKKYFQHFQIQLHDSNGYFVEVIKEDASHCVYKTKRVFVNNGRERTLILDKVSNIVTCSCKMFEFEGIPCRHILAFLRMKQIMELPKNYILRRWTRFSRVHKETSQSQDGGDSSLIMKRNGMFKTASDIIDEATISHEGADFVTKSFDGLLQQIRELNLYAGQPIKENVIVGAPQENRFLDPLQAKTKGSGKRLTSWRDRKGKVRRCSICRSTNHTRRTCKSVGIEIPNDVDQTLDGQDHMVDDLYYEVAAGGDAGTFNSGEK